MRVSWLPEACGKQSWCQPPKQIFHISSLCPLCDFCARLPWSGRSLVLQEQTGSVGGSPGRESHREREKGARRSCRESRSRMRRQGVGGNDDWVVTLTSSPPSKGQVTALLRLPSQLVILLRYLSVAPLFQHVLGVWYSEHIVLTAGWRPHSLRGCLAKKEWKWFWNFIAKRGS